MDFQGDFKILCERIFEPCNLKVSNPKKEDESAEYQAHFFKINNKSVRYRLAKVTPTKTGQFVTIWKRTGKNPIQPYDSNDDIDLFVVTVKTLSHFGQFVFPKSALRKHGVLSIKGKGGKRALRVYPPWDQVNSRQARTTQAWQLEFFAELSKNKLTNIQNFKPLY